MVSVTVGIPTYNRLAYLKEAVDSVLCQHYPDYELLISQNPCDDQRTLIETADYCARLSKRDSRVRYQLRAQNFGPPENFQWLVDNARGDYVLLIGDDDHLMPNALEVLTRGIAPGVVVSFGRRHIIDEHGQRQPRCVGPEKPDPTFFGGWPFSQYEVPGGRLADAELWAWRQAMGVETSLVRTADFRRVRYREDVDMPDLEFFIALSREGGDFVFVPEYVTEYRFHSNSTTGRGFNNFKELFDDLERLTVRAEIEQYKRELLEMLAFQALRKGLCAGDATLVHSLLASSFCPRAVREGARGLAIKLSKTLPGTLGAQALSFVYSIKHKRSRRPPNV